MKKSVEFGKFAIEIGVSAFKYLGPDGQHACRRLMFSITAVYFFDDVHPFDDLADGGKAGSMSLRAELSPRLINTWVDRVLGPVLEKAT